MLVRQDSPPKSFVFRFRAPDVGGAQEKQLLRSFINCGQSLFRPISRYPSLVCRIGYFYTFVVRKVFTLRADTVYLRGAIRKLNVIIIIIIKKKKKKNHTRRAAGASSRRLTFGPNSRTVYSFRIVR